jgi:hypothetical protein
MTRDEKTLGERRRWASLGPLALLLIAACQPTARPSAADTVGYPRCVASDPDGNQLACTAPARANDGDRCACADRRGLAFYGRVQEYKRP